MCVVLSGLMAVIVCVGVASEERDLCLVSFVTKCFQKKIIIALGFTIKERLTIYTTPQTEYSGVRYSVSKSVCVNYPLS